MTPKLLRELRTQQEFGYKNGIAVKLYKKSMSALTKVCEEEMHSQYHRIWMDGEYEVLTSVQVKKLKKQWDKNDGESI